MFFCKVFQLGLGVSREKSSGGAWSLGATRLVSYSRRRHIAKLGCGRYAKGRSSDDWRGWSSFKGVEALIGLSHQLRFFQFPHPKVVSTNKCRSRGRLSLRVLVLAAKRFVRSALGRELESGPSKRNTRTRGVPCVCRLPHGTHPFFARGGQIENPILISTIRLIREIS